MKKKFIIITISVLLTFIISFFIYVNDYYKAIDISDYITSNEKVKINKTNDGYYFDGEGKNNLIIMYPGAKVDYLSYAPLLYKLAMNGIDCFIVKMPFNIAFFGINKGNDIIKKYNYEHYYVVGHSLGGVVLTSFINNNQNIDGIIYLASYPNKKVNIKMISIYGDNDKILNMDSYNNNKKYWSNDSKEIIIKGGNHSSFASYGLQKGDGKYLLDNNEQIDITVKEIINFIDDKG